MCKTMSAPLKTSALVQHASTLIELYFPALLAGRQQHKKIVADKFSDLSTTELR